MAITSAEVRAAVDLYLPRGVNYARSGDLGDVNREEVFQRLIQVILVALLVDQDAFFYLVYVTSQRLLRDIDTAIDLLKELEGSEELRAVTSVAPQRISDLTLLKESREDLLGLSGSLAQDIFGIDHFNRFATSLGGFLTDQIAPNVQGGNRVKLEVDIRATMEQLQTSWSSVILRRAKLFSLIDKYQAADLRVSVAASVISSVQLKLLALETELPTQSTSEHAQSSRQILIELAAAQAALQIIADAKTPFGTVIVPASADGTTPATYLKVEGEALLDPVLPIVSAEDGRLFFDDVLVSTTGQTVADVDPARPNTTKILEDASVVDFEAFVSVGDTLTLVDTGSTFQVEATTPTQLTLSPPTLYVAATDQRYVVTQTAPGTFFRSDSIDFWDVFTGGVTASSEIASGTQGSFPRQPKASGSDGTNQIVSGTGATISPSVSFLADSLADFVGNGVLAADEVFITASVNPVNTSGSPYTISSVGAPDPSVVQVVGDDFDSIEIGTIDYDIVRTTLLRSPTASFTSLGVVAGDEVLIDGFGPFTILSVISQTELELSAPHTVNLTAGTAVFEIYAPPGTTSDTFVQADGVDFVALEVTDTIPVEEFRTVYNPETGVSEDATATALLPAILNTGGPDYAVGSRVAASTLRITTDAPRQEASTLVWSLRAGDVTKVFTDASGAFLSYKVGDTLVYRPGEVGELRVSIAKIVSATELWVGSYLPQGESSLNYAIISLVKSGDELIFAGRRYGIDSVQSLHVLRMLTPTTNSPGKEIKYLVVPKGTSPGTFLLTDNALDPVKFPLGFPLTLQGEFIDIMSGVPLRGKVTRVLDRDTSGTYETLEVNFALPVGQRDVSYRVRTETADTSDEFRTENALAANLVTGDLLTVWGVDFGVTVNSTAVDGSEFVSYVSPLLPSRLADQVFIAVRGGGRDHGRYLLLEDQNADVVLDADTSQLRLKVAEVLIDFGVDEVLIVAGAAGIVVDDSDGNSTSPLFRDATVDFVAADAHIGDRLTVLIDPDGVGGIPPTVYTTFVTAVVDSTNLQVSPELPTPDPVVPLTWDLERTSVSTALEESTSMREQLVALKGVLDLYTVPRNETIHKAMDLLQQQNMGRAVDLLNDGDFDLFLAMTSTDSSYSSRARAALQGTGSTVTPAASLGGRGPSTYSQLAGVDPATGKSAPYSTAASSSQYTMPQSGSVHSALASAITDLVSAEQTSSMAQESLEESRNRAVYELSGTVVSGAISDQDPTLPWIDRTGSKRSKIERSAQRVLDAIQYMLDHPDEFCDVEDATS